VSRGTQPWTAGGSGQNSSTILVSCIPHRGARLRHRHGEKHGEEVLPDVKVTGGCTIILGEGVVTALFDLLGMLLG